MTFFEAMDADLAKILDAPVGPGEDVEVLPHDSETPVDFRAVFDQPGQVVSLGSSSGIASEAPYLHLRERDFYSLLGRPMSRKEIFAIRGREYRFEQPDPDSTGWISLKLLEV